MRSPALRTLVGAAVVLVCAGSIPSFQEDQGQLGPLTREDILSGNPDWLEVVALYQPDPAALDRLRSLEAPVWVDVFLGTWCSDSKAHVGAFFKVLEAADNPLLAASFMGVPRDKSKRAEYLRGQDIQKLPTFIVTVGGREKGRIVEVPAKSVEQDLLDILGR